ncbi:SO_0444 family Cu/Zn efflux transporter, partial [bacterium]|nr:SO_0444 family Cu/Zn efflux transporter [bacterium]
MIDFLVHFATETWRLTAEMAGWLLLGFAVAGLLSVFISPVWMERHLGGRGLAPVFKASLFGVPLPLCSCGVIPVAASLRQHGASRAATTAFLLSTPQTGVDSILITYSMLGPFFAVFRPLAALATGVLGGAAVQAAEPDAHRSSADGRGLAGANGVTDDRPRGLAARLRAAWSYGTVTLPGDIGRALLWGILIAGLIAAAVPEDFLGAYLGRGPLSIALMMAVGIPIYVCATASVPLAAGFIALGATPGAALAFLVAGPATNAATLTTIGRVLGRRTMLIYLATVAVAAFGGGVLLDWLMPRAADLLPALGDHAHHHDGVAWWHHVFGAALVAVMTWSWWRSRRQPDCCEDGACHAPAEGTTMQKQEFVVEGMNCSHCQN